MKKKLISIMGLTVCVVLAITACESRAVREAKEAYKSEDYATVVEKLTDEQIDDSGIARMFDVSQIHVAYDNAQYTDVVKILQNMDAEIDDPEIKYMATISKAYVAFDDSKYAEVIEELQSLDEKIEDPDIERMLTISEAYVAYDNNQYLDVIKKLQEVDDKTEAIYEDSCEKYVDTVVDQRDVDAIPEIYELESSTGECIFKKLTSPCDDLNYQAFIYLENVTSKLPESELKTQLTDYSEENSVNRIRAFFIGEWEWQSEDDVKTRVKVIAYKDNLLGEVTQVGDNEVEYQLLVGDIYWKEYEFVDDTFYTCNNLSKTKDGLVVEITATGKIDYENNSINMHLTAPEPYIMVYPDRHWTRVS